MENIWLQVAQIAFIVDHASDQSHRLVTQHELSEPLSDLVGTHKSVVQVFFGHQRLELLKSYQFLSFALACTAP